MLFIYICVLCIFYINAIYIYISICRGSAFFDEVKEFLESEEKNLNFQDWSYSYALLPNVERKASLRPNLKVFQEEGNCVITADDDIVTELKLKEMKKHENNREYQALARAIITSFHVGRAANTIGPIEPIASATERTFKKIAGQGAAPIGPGFNPDILDKSAIDKEVSYTEVKDSKDPANSLEVWILWHPQQAQAIRNITFPTAEEKEEVLRYLIQGAYGTGKTSLLMNLAIKSVSQGKKTCFWSMLDEESSYCHFNRFIENVCRDSEVDFTCGKQNIEERMKRLAEKTYDVLLIDEMKIAKDPAVWNDQASDDILR